MSGIEGVRILGERHPSIATVLLTVFKDDDRIFRAICAGACGYLLKKTAPARLLEAVKDIAEGGAVMSPGSCHPRDGAISANRKPPHSWPRAYRPRNYGS